MRFYFRLLAFTAVLLTITVETRMNAIRPPTQNVPALFRQYQASIKNQFIKPENANLLFGFMFGAQQGISPHTRKAFEVNNLSFLLSPSGIHLGAILLIVSFFLKNTIRRKWRKKIQLILLSFIFFLPHQEALKRIIFLKYGFYLKFIVKSKIRPENILLLCFVLAFICGHYFKSPLGFIFSFLYIGTFFSMADRPKSVLLMALFINQILLAIFLGNKVSLLSVISGFAFASLFSALYVLCFVFFSTYWFFPINWIEPFIQFYVHLLKYAKILITPNLTSSSLFLFLAAITLLVNVRTQRGKILFALFLLLHTNTAMTPAIFSS